MENVDIVLLPALAESYLRLHSIATKNTDPAQFVPLGHLMAVPAMYIIEISTLLPEVYKQAWQSLRIVHSQLQQRNTRSSSSGKGLGDDVPRLAPPEPEPEPPAAPPYVPSPFLPFDPDFSYTPRRPRVPLSHIPHLTNPPSPALSSYPHPVKPQRPTSRHRTLQMQPLTLRHSHLRHLCRTYHILAGNTLVLFLSLIFYLVFLPF